MYKERLENLNNQAVILGIDLNYQPAIAVENIEDLTHQEWLNSRKKGIGGSDAGAIFGVSRYSTATEIALDKSAKNINAPLRMLTNSRGFPAYSASI